MLTFCSLSSFCFRYFGQVSSPFMLMSHFHMNPQDNRKHSPTPDLFDVVKGEFSVASQKCDWPDKTLPKRWERSEFILPVNVHLASLLSTLPLSWVDGLSSSIARLLIWLMSCVLAFLRVLIYVREYLCVLVWELIRQEARNYSWLR